MTDDPRSDNDLVDAINAGDVDAFEVLYRRYREWAARLARRFTGSDDIAADAVQDTFLYFLRQFPGFELRARLTTFLYPVVKHTAQGIQRKARRASPTNVDDVLPAIEAEDDATFARRSELAAVIAALPPAQHETVLMRFVDGMAIGEIAIALGIPTGTVKSRLHNALATLREDPRTRSYFGREESSHSE
jgi:RNA polymerase sigma-70 factor (ECF subfamily)